MFPVSVLPRRANVTRSCACDSVSGLYHDIYDVESIRRWGTVTDGGDAGYSADWGLRNLGLSAWMQNHLHLPRFTNNHGTSHHGDNNTNNNVCKSFISFIRHAF